MQVVEGYAPSKPLQMNGSVAAARRPANPGQRQPHARRPHASSGRGAHAHAGAKRPSSAPRGNGGRRDSGKQR
jgi:ATP-dependent RNA helicase RhlE